MFVPQTVQSACTVSGIGLHTGSHVHVEVRPAPAGRGRVFMRDRVAIPALVDYVVDTRRCTTLGRDGTTIATVEHLLAAMTLAGIDDAEIVVDGPELPALDGAASEWFAILSSAGVCSPNTEIQYVACTVMHCAWVVEGTSEFFLFPAQSLIAHAAISIPETIVDRMAAGGDIADPATRDQIARARTYGLEREVQALRDAGLAQGGSLDNAVILTRDGYLNDQVWPDEPAWHKVLDLVGDLALVGTRVQGQILALRGGHHAHVALAQRLRVEHLHALSMRSNVALAG